MAKEKKESAFMHWYESYEGKKVVGIVYSVGASVVIIGALFKILHWPGASQVLMVGMFTEAFLFVIGALDKPHPEFHWEEVFPQLLGYGTNPEILEAYAEKARPTLLNSNEAAAAKKDAPAVPTIPEKDVEALKAGIANLSKTAQQLASLGGIADTTNKLASQMEQAGQAAEKFVGSQNGLLAASEQLGNAYTSVSKDMDIVVKNTQAYGKQVEVMNTQLGSINSLYELQLKNIQAQADQMKASSASIDQMAVDAAKMQTAMAAAMAASEKAADGSKKLEEQISDLNKVYGNMLNALA